MRVIAAIELHRRMSSRRSIYDQAVDFHFEWVSVGGEGDLDDLEAHFDSSKVVTRGQFEGANGVRDQAKLLDEVFRNERPLSCRVE